MAVKPTALTLRCYGVGFGDCFLLSFHYKAAADRHVLIDFGMTQKPPNPRKNLMVEIAKDIAKTVGTGPLHLLVATHRHADHINGFATNKRGTGPGDIIAGLSPQLVVQPWTERPDAPKDFEGKSTSLKAAGDDTLRLSLVRMGRVAAASMKEAVHLPAAAAREIRFLGADGLSNMSAVRNLAKMGKKTAYVQYGSKLPQIASLLPGIKISVLGPPSIAQKADVLTQNPVNRDEYWHFSRFWGMRAATADVVTTGGSLFPNAPVHKRSAIPVENRWFVQRLKTLRGEALLRISRAMDDALNNTSVILLIEAGSRKLLFPGDAQWENWEHTLGKDAKRLEDVDLYKVGHHGSLNATPKTLWAGFTKKSTDRDEPGRLLTVMSTRSDSKHGHRENGTEVPRDKLIRALKKDSLLRSTQELEEEGGLVMVLEYDL
jgi:hypothetical protein